MRFPSIIFTASLSAAALSSALFFIAPMAAEAESAPPPAAAAPLPANAAAGKALFQRRCAACHYADSSRNKIGPSLQGIYDRPAGQVASFPYSAAMKAAAGKNIVWTKENLAQFLQAPQHFIPGTRMVIAPRLAPNEAEVIIRYLAQDKAPPAK